MKERYRSQKEPFLLFVKNELDSLETELNSDCLLLNHRPSNCLDYLSRNWEKLQNEMVDGESTKDTIGATIINLYILLLSTDWKQPPVLIGREKTKTLFTFPTEKDED